MNTIQLDFQTDAIKFVDIFNKIPEICNSGIYVWGFKENDKFIPYYVGQANKTTIYNRLCSHYFELGNRRYTLFKSKKLFEFRAYLDKHKCKKSLNIPEDKKDDVLAYFNNEKSKNIITQNEYLKNPLIKCSANFYRENFYFKYCIISQDKDSEIDFQTKLNYIESDLKFWLDDNCYPTISDCKYGFESKKYKELRKIYKTVIPTQLIIQ